jgi:hypothetical protein
MIGMSRVLQWSNLQNSSCHALPISLNSGELTKTNRKDRLVIIRPFGNIFVDSRKRIF